jgi:outer membrane protein assembly factor BamB
MSRFLLALGALYFLAGTASANGEPPPPVGWPQILRDNAHSSVSPDVNLRASTASTLGLSWMSALRSADIGSPVSVYSTALGRNVVYVGDERGDVIAYDALTGTTLWSTSIGIGDAVRSSPLVAPDGSVWIGTANSSTIAKLDGTTGQILCSLVAPHHLNASFMYASPPGGVPTVYTATNHNAVSNGPELALNESDCSIVWSFDQWLTLSGAWGTPAFAVDATGNGRVFVGTADPDSTMYSVDAVTGKEVWHYSALNPPDGIFDIGAAATVSAPGNNGFADGVLYFPSKYGVMYALDLTTGKPIWQYNFNKAAHLTQPGIAAAALYKTELVYGVGDGVENVNAQTGKLIWHYVDASKQPVISSPAIAGPSGDEIVVCADATGLVTVLRLSDGTLLYKYQTTNYITASPAIISGHILIDSADGFLYDFANGGYNVAAPSTTIASPKTGSSLSNPGTKLTISGTATSNSGNGVSQVQVSVQRGGPTGPWYSSPGIWWSGAANIFVPVDTPGKQTSTWSLTLPVLRAGSTFQVTANAVDAHHQVDTVGAQSSFSVLPNKNAPQLTLSTTTVAPSATFVASGGPFKANETVDFSLQNTTLGTALAGANGLVANTSLKIPSSASFGPSALLATGETSHKATSAAVDVTNVWTQFGYDSTRSGFEPNDTILENTLQSTNGGYLSVAWRFATGGAVEAPPAIVDGVAYVANTLGKVSAVDIVSGSALWTYTILSGAAIHGAPAVGNGDVVFGADDGDIYRLASATGSLLGAIVLDGVPASPALVGNTIYAATDNGTVYAIDEASGTQLWATPVGAAIHMAPSVDATGGVVVVGDDSGNVTTLNSATGSIVGQVSTGAAVTVAPALARSSVFVGSSDGRLRSYAESSRKLAWTYGAGSPIGALAVSGNVFLGTDAGVVSNLSAASGRIVFATSPFDSGIVGVSAAPDINLVATSKGDISVIKDNEGPQSKYTYSTSGALSTQPEIVDGAVYLGAQDGNLYAFTTFGQAPQGAVEHQLLLGLRKAAKIPAPWVRPRIPSRTSIATRAFAPHGSRDFALHIERSRAPATQNVRASDAARTYVLGWSPVGERAAAIVDRTRTLLGPVAGFALDTTAYPRPLDDAAIQREVARAIARNAWNVSANTRFVVLTASGPVSAMPYCAYHSAFYLAGNLTLPVVYGVVPGGTTELCGPIVPQIARAWRELEIDPFARAR